MSAPTSSGRKSPIFIPEPGSGNITPTQALYANKYEPFLKVWNSIAWEKYNIFDVLEEEPNDPLRQTLSQSEWEAFYKVHMDHPLSGENRPDELKYVQDFLFTLAVSWGIPVEAIQREVYSGPDEMGVSRQFNSTGVRHLYEWAIVRHMKERIQSVRQDEASTGQQQGGSSGNAASGAASGAAPEAVPRSAPAA